AAQRKRREIDPVLTTLRRCRDALAADELGTAAKRPAAKERYRRVDELLSFLQLMDHLATEFLASHKSLKAAVRRLTAARRGRPPPRPAPPGRSRSSRRTA